MGACEPSQIFKRASSVGLRADCGAGEAGRHKRAAAALGERWGTCSGYRFWIHLDRFWIHLDSRAS